MANFPLQNIYDGTRYVIRGPEVLTLQKWLNQTKKPDWPTIKEDGIFGPNTEAAVLRATGVTLVTREYYDRVVMRYFSRDQVPTPTPRSSSNRKIIRTLGVLAIVLAGVGIAASIDPDREKT